MFGSHQCYLIYSLNSTEKEIVKHFSFLINLENQGFHGLIKSLDLFPVFLGRFLKVLLIPLGAHFC